MVKKSRLGNYIKAQKKYYNLPIKNQIVKYFIMHYIEKFVTKDYKLARYYICD